MKLHGTSVAVGAGTVLVLIAIFAWPYKDAILYAINHRKELSIIGEGASVVSQFKGLFS